MGVNQDFGAYDLNIDSGNSVIVTDTYSAGGKVYCRTTIITLEGITSWVEVSTPSYDSGRENPATAGGWIDTVYAGYAARQKEWEITVAAWEELRIEMYGLFLAGISFGEFQMNSRSLAAFNETFSGSFDEIFYQNDFTTNFVDAPGAITITDADANITNCELATTGASSIKFLAAAITQIDLSSKEYFLNFRAFSGSTYGCKVWLHNSAIGWMCLDTNVDDLGFDQVRPVVSMNTLMEKYEAIGTLTVYQSGYETTEVNYSAFDGTINGIGIISIRPHLDV